MLGFVIHPAHARERYPGQAPRLDRELDRMFTMPTEESVTRLYAEPPRPVLRAEMVADGLGLPQHVERDIAFHMKSDLAAASNELDFRRNVVSYLLERKMAPSLRRAILSRALSFFRNTSRKATGRISKAARGGRYHRRVPTENGMKYFYDQNAYERYPGAHVSGQDAQTEYLRKRVERMLESGKGKFHVNLMGALVAKYGAKAIGEAVRACGARLEKDMICKAQRPSLHLVVSKAAENLPSSTDAIGGDSQRGAGGRFGSGPSAKKTPVGTRRVWHNRIVEKLPDEKWHVVGHVAGLEDPKKVPILDQGEISAAHLHDLILKIKKIIEEEKRRGVHREDGRDASSMHG